MRKLLIIPLLFYFCLSFGQSGISIPGIASPRFSVPRLTYRYWGSGMHLVTDIDSVNLLLALKANLSGGNTLNGTQIINTGFLTMMYGVPIAFENPTVSAYTGFLVENVSNGNHNWIIPSRNDTLAGTSQIRKLDTIITSRYVPKTTTVAGFALSGNVTLANFSSADLSVTVSGAYNGSTSRTIAVNQGFAFNWTGAQTYANSIALNANNTYSFGSTTNGFAALYSRIISSNSALTFNTSNSNSMLFQIGGTELMRLASTGGFLINTTTDNFTDKLQVNGSILGTGLKSSGFGGGKALVSSGTSITESSVTSTQLGYLGTTTSDVQTQLNSKGAGTVTSVSSANTDIGVATGTTTPVLTFNRGLTTLTNYVDNFSTQVIGGTKTFSLNAIFNAGAQINPSFVLQWGASGNFGQLVPPIFTGARSWTLPDASGPIGLTFHGNSTTTGAATTTVTVTIGTTMTGTNYFVAITPRDLLTAVNYYISAKTTTTFDVTFVTALTGSINFDYNITTP